MTSLKKTNLLNASIYKNSSQIASRMLHILHLSNSSKTFLLVFILSAWNATIHLAYTLIFLHLQLHYRLQPTCASVFYHSPLLANLQFPPLFSTGPHHLLLVSHFGTSTRLKMLNHVSRAPAANDKTHAESSSAAYSLSASLYKPID